MTSRFRSVQSAISRLRVNTIFTSRIRLAASMLGIVIVSVAWAGMTPRWSAEERATLRSLSLGSLETLRADPSNEYADDRQAAALGRQLFFETRLSGNGKISCASCHLPARDFQDARALAIGVGTTARRTMPVAATAHSPWMFWDGRADSQWAQALGPLESAAEHGGSRTLYAHVVARHYRAQYESVFGRLPDLAGLPQNAGPVPDSAWRDAWEHIPSVRQQHITRVYANLGKAIAAYERQITYAPSRFDRYVAAELADDSRAADGALSPDEVAGLRLFIGKGSCVNCHNGPRFTDDHFHNTGVPASTEVVAPDSGRAAGARQAVAGEFSCTSRYSDAKPDDCSELRFAVVDGPELVRAFKTPSLRNVTNRAPYMHAGQLGTLEDVLRHYNTAPRAPFGHSELKALKLSSREQGQLVAFMRTLSGPLAAPAGYLDPPPMPR